VRTRVLATVVAATLSCLALTTGAPPTAYADHGGPSANQVAASKARVARLERKVAAAAEAVSRSQAALERLRTAAEVAVEAFNKAQVQQATAARNLDAARLVVAAADARVSAVRGDVGKFAVAAYEGGTLSTVDLLLSSHGPDTMLYRLGALDAVSRSQRDVIQALSAAEVYQRAVQQQAASVLMQSQRAAEAADAARRHAASLVADQAAGVARLSAASDHLSVMLTNARAHASALERARLQALAQARAQADAARRAAALRAAQDRANRDGGSQQSSGSGGTQNFGATVSASTEQGALQAAESQLGKPYEWGAAGPDTYDCSGLVMWAYAQVGEHVDHWTGDQWNEGAHIPVSALRAGDLLFFATDTTDPNTIHHVGMYVGNGQMIEAPYTGANVRYNDAFRPDLIGAVRLYNR
jgi:cell wall-associated NlpC family hydrolase